MTTTALGLALTWPRRVLLAECDPAGRRVLPGFMADRLRGPAGPGVLGLATRTPQASGTELPLEEYVVPMDGDAELLHGVRDPRNVSQLGSLWSPLAKAFTARDGDVLADLGRVGGAETPVALLDAADLVVMVLKPTLAQVDAATPRLEVLRGLAPDRLALCLVPDGPYSAAEVERALKLPVLGEPAFSPNEARVLSDGARPRMTFRTSLLMRSLESLGRRLRTAMAEPEAKQVPRPRVPVRAFGKVRR
ncbi:hypothetical protein [Actinomadura sp. WAC 06369]|uniref:hypothetical protein n=1 Tax=Actinomadura sp. WAC 06369 TaxID=2203193 RepID=UPI000F7ABC6B|nr:hypothetical protein [Actinomadura sp. WAC 06369]